MIHLPASVRVYLCLAPCDMRKSFDGLHAIVRDAMQLDALDGHLFVFTNRRRDGLKILYWDRDGFAIWSQTAGGRYVRGALRRCWCAIRDHRRRVGGAVERHRPEPGRTPQTVSAN
jgi:hypothetical protein